MLPNALDSSSIFSLSLFVLRSKDQYKSNQVMQGISTRYITNLHLPTSRMVSSGLLRRVTLVTRATRCNNPEDTILHSHRRENLKSYTNIKFGSLSNGCILEFLTIFHQIEKA
jgi:hypothetical protein